VFDLLWLVLGQLLLLSSCRFDKGLQQTGEKVKINLKKQLNNKYSVIYKRLKV
jgi:hypothetical protein